MLYTLEGLEKNQHWYDVKKLFFQFGYVKKFQYNRNGTASLEFSHLKNEEKLKLITFLETHNIKHVETSKEKDYQINTQATSKSFQNPSLHYYQEAYGKDIETFQLNNTYKALFDLDSVSDDEKFQLTTLYPGLLVGSGYNHPKLPTSSDDFQLGFFFDHTTGLPIISASSIKGVVRSLFASDKKDFLTTVYADLIKDDIEVVEKRLFLDGSTIFYDAYIVSTSEYNKGKIFGSDYITSPHSDDPMGQFKEPNPVKFLKVLSDVTFKFQFKGRSEDVALIKAIILDFGLGAKTNVGYGQFRE